AEACGLGGSLRRQGERTMSEGGPEPAFTRLSCDVVILSANAGAGSGPMLSPIERWRLRHAYPDAIGLWAVATGKEAQALAFSAIAQDPRVLEGAARMQAVRLVTQAEDFARSVAETLAVDNDAWRAATQLVERSIAAWRGALKAFDVRPEDPYSALAVPPAS